MGKFSCWGAMFASLYLHNKTSSLSPPYSIVFQSVGPTTFFLIITPTITPIKSYKVGIQPMHPISSFAILPKSQQSFRLIKGDIARLIESSMRMFVSRTASFYLIPIKGYKGYSDFTIGFFDSTTTPNT